MAKKPVLLQFDDELLERLDQYATTVDRSRSAVVRDAVERYIATESEAEKDRRLVEGYTRIPDTGEFDTWALESGRDAIEEESW